MIKSCYLQLFLFALKQYDIFQILLLVYKGVIFYHLFYIRLILQKKINIDQDQEGALVC